MKFEFGYQCDVEWDEMHGGDRRRFCDSCEKHVHHISGMTQEEALQFLEEHDWNVCVDFYRDDDGHTVFREPSKKLRMQNEGLRQLLASAAAVVPLALAAAFIDFDEPHQDAGRVIAETETDPIDLGGPRPVVSAPVIPTPTAPEEHRSPEPDLPLPDEEVVEPPFENPFEETEEPPPVEEPPPLPADRDDEDPQVKEPDEPPIDDYRMRGLIVPLDP